MKHEVLIYIWSIIMRKETVQDISFVLLLSGICHFLFSKYGFNPTDEGFVLSATNRVLHGQIPHVDFSSVRPLGYAYLHIPELLISKTHFFLVSRFVFWLEQALIAYWWIRFLLNCSKQELSTLNKYALILICFIFNVHYFPASVLHTVDGLLMCMIGLNLISSDKKWHYAGFFFIGFAALCKQNYLVFLPLTLHLFKRKSVVLHLLSGISPILFYVVYVCMNGGCIDLLTQLSGHNELLKVGVARYLFNPMPYLGIIVFFIYHKLRFNRTLFSSLITMTAVVLLVTNHYHGKYVFLFFGMICSECIYRLVKKEPVIPAFVTLLSAWSVSISVGYNTPALFTGGMISFLLFDSFASTTVALSKKTVYSILAISILAFYHSRTHNIYRDLPATQLTYKLDHIVEGASGIHTNKNTYDVLQELDSLRHSTPNLMVIPDFTACNILHSHQSKILTEWPNKTEVPNDKILQKITSDIRNDTTSVLAIPKYQTALLKDGFVILENHGDEYPIVNYLLENKYMVIEEKKYFYILRKIHPPSNPITENEYINLH